MSESLWAASAAELLRRTASAAPTSGGGSIAAINIDQLDRLISSAAPAPHLRRGALLAAREENA